MHCLPWEHLFLYSTNLNLGFWWAHSRCGFGYGDLKSLLMKVITYFQMCLSLTFVYHLTSLCFCFWLTDSAWEAVSVMTKDSLFVSQTASSLKDRASSFLTWSVKSALHACYSTCWEQLPSSMHRMSTTSVEDSSQVTHILAFQQCSPVPLSHPI